MASKDFVAVSWTSDQLLDEDTLDQMNNNITWIRNQMVNGKYMQLNGGVVDQSLKILCGRNIITPRKGASATIRVSFASMFTPNSIPIVTTSIISPSQAKIFLIVNGIGRLQPNHQGFEATVNIAKESVQDRIAKSLYLNWIAMGY